MLHKTNAKSETATVQVVESFEMVSSNHGKKREAQHEKETPKASMAKRLQPSKQNGPALPRAASMDQKRFFSLHLLKSPQTKTNPVVLDPLQQMEVSVKHKSALAFATGHVGLRN